MISLQDFVRETIREICNGVREASAIGATVNPPGFLAGYQPVGDHGRTGPHDQDNGARYIAYLRFDVAVTASSSSEVEKGASAKVWVLGGNLDATTKQEQVAVSRVQFMVPCQLPTGKPL